MHRRDIKERHATRESRQKTIKLIHDMTMRGVRVSGARFSGVVVKVFARIRERKVNHLAFLGQHGRINDAAKLTANRVRASSAHGKYGRVFR
jgi:hypothetical protein